MLYVQRPGAEMPIWWSKHGGTGRLWWVAWCDIKTRWGWLRLCPDGAAADADEDGDDDDADEDDEDDDAGDEDDAGDDDDDYSVADCGRVNLSKAKKNKDEQQCRCIFSLFWRVHACIFSAGPLPERNKEDLCKSHSRWECSWQRWKSYEFSEKVTSAWSNCSHWGCDRGGKCRHLSSRRPTTGYAFHCILSWQNHCIVMVDCQPWETHVRCERQQQSSSLRDGWWYLWSCLGGLTRRNLEIFFSGYLGFGCLLHPSSDAKW